MPLPHPSRPPRAPRPLRTRALSSRWYEISVRPPAWLSAPRTRRALAAALVVLAAVIALRADPNGERMAVVVAARDLRPGEVLAAGDVTVTMRAADEVPDGVTTAVADAVDHTVAGPVRAGESLTDVRLLGQRLAQATIAAPDARVVPVRLADPALADIVRSGDTVSVVTVAPETNEPTGGAPAARVLAEDAAVVAVSDPGTTARGADRLVLLAMGAEAATAVAAASLVTSLTVTLR